MNRTIQCYANLGNYSQENRISFRCKNMAVLRYVIKYPHSDTCLCFIHAKEIHNNEYINKNVVDISYIKS